MSILHHSRQAANGRREFGRKDADNSSEGLPAGAAEVIEHNRKQFMSMGERVSTLEQKMARSGSAGGFVLRAQSPGRRFIDSEEFAALKGNIGPGRVASLEMKAIITSLTTDADGSAGDLVVPSRDLTVVMPQRRLTVRDLCSVIEVASGSVEYAKQTGRTIGAATVAEGDPKPTSELKYDLVNVPIRTIAHYVLASVQILDDAPQLAGLIDSDLRYGLAYVEDHQLLNGGGTGTDLNGIYNQATSYAAPIVPSEAGNLNKIDVIGLGLLQQALTGIPADGIVLHPSDWLDMKLTKDAEGRYLLGDPQSDAPPVLFGKPVVESEAMTVDKFLVGGFKTNATIYDRQKARVDLSTEDSDNFRKNLVTLRGEERIGLAVKNTTGFTKGDFSEALAA